jgi:hypothetical protein
VAVTINTARKIALSLPGVEERICHGTPAFYVRRKLIFRLREDEETLAIAYPKAQRAGLIESRPDVFSVTEHYENYDYVLLDLLAAKEELLHEMIVGAWSRKAARKDLAAYDHATRAR